MRNFFCEQLTKPCGDLPHVPLPATLPTATLPLGDKDSRNSSDFKAYEWQWLHSSIQVVCPLGKPTDTWEFKKADLRARFSHAVSAQACQPLGKWSGHVCPCDERTRMWACEECWGLSLISRRGLRKRRTALDGSSRWNLEIGAVSEMGKKCFIGCCCSRPWVPGMKMLTPCTRVAW